jgi:hypothetical protein
MEEGDVAAGVVLSVVGVSTVAGSASNSSSTKLVTAWIDLQNSVNYYIASDKVI